MPHLARAIKDRLCVDIDLHKDTMTVASLNPVTGEVTYRKLACKCREQIVEFFTSLAWPHGVAIARKLLLCLWAVARDGQPYRPVGRTEDRRAA